jgi:predicted ATPase/class 3 adenylate cyclase
MLSDLAGYRITEELAVRSKSYVARGVREQSRVVLKAPANDYPSERERAALRHEHTMLSRLSVPGVVRCVGVETDGSRPVLVLEDDGGISLGEFVAGRPLDLRTFFAIAVRTARILEAVHGAGVIHRDLNPSNIVIHPETRALWLIDFGMATTLAREASAPVAVSQHLGTLLYISPEQTGRTNRSVDARSDLYSLGATLYQLLLGRPPFVVTDPAELVHSHLARTPESPSSLRPDVPRVLSAILLKLLAKSAEDRYRSAAGLRVDLERCEAALLETGTVPVFAIAQHDLSPQFLVSELLYGRETEVAEVLDAFRRATEGEAQLLLVAGYSGVGKTRLVREVQRPVGTSWGYLVEGKVDQFRHDVPLAPLASALRQLVRLVLAESAASVARWRTRLVEALGPNGQVVVDVVPELEHLLGPQPAVPELPPSESRNRFLEVFGRFVDTFARVEHPLAIFIDDLQWVDAATLGWMEDALSQGSNRALLILGAYRDNEVGPDHPLSLTRDRLVKRGVELRALSLQPLSASAVEEWVARTLGCPVEAAREFAALVHQRTGGNPFAVGQMLTMLHEDGALRLEPSKGHWVADLERARLAKVSENIVDLLLHRIRRLPEASSRALGVASILGSEVSLDLLAGALGTDPSSTADAVWAAVSQDLMVEGETVDTDRRFRFTHDRVQQAARSLLADDEARRLRLDLGRRLQATAEGDDARLFEVASHLNAASVLIVEAAERRKLGETNLAAASRARRAAAFSPARDFARAGLAVVDAAEVDGLRRGLLLELAQAEHLCGDNASAARRFEEAMAASTTDVEQADVAEKQVHFFTDQSQFREAYDAGRRVLATFGISPPARFVPPALIADFLALTFRLRRWSTARILAHHEVSDPRMRAAMRLYGALLKVAYQIRPELCVHGAIRLAQLHLTHGNTPESPLTWFVWGGIFNGGILGRHAVGHDYGKLALGLVDRFQANGLRSEVNFIHAYFATSWVRPVAEAEDHWRIAYQAGLDSGDHFHVGCSIAATTQSRFMRGVPIQEVLTESARYLNLLGRIKNPELLGTVLGVRATLAELSGVTPEDVSDFDRAAFERSLQGWGSRHFAHYWLLNRLRLLVHGADVTSAEQAIRASGAYAKDSAGMLHSAEHEFLGAMLVARRGGTGATGVLKKAVARFDKLAARNPANFAHRAALLRAELLRAQGNTHEAQTQYDLALREAATRGYLNDEALSAERAASLHFAAGRERLGRVYLRDAVYAYRRWGAYAVADRLADEHPEALSERTLAAVRTASSVSISSSDESASSLDFASVLKSSAAISSEVQIERLLAKLLRILIEVGGAERGLLLLSEGGRLTLQAEDHIDQDEAAVLQGTPLEDCENLSEAVVLYVTRTRQRLVLADASADPLFRDDPYVRRTHPRSVLCAPVLQQGQLLGVLYLENNLATSAFAESRLEVLSLLSGQVATSIANAQLYEHLERKVAERSRQIEQERERSDQLLLNILPKETADELKALGRATPRRYEQVSVLFTDFQGFTGMSAVLSPEELIADLDLSFGRFDAVCSAFGVEKIKTIGDAYMCAGGIPIPNRTNAADVVCVGLAFQRTMLEINSERASRGLEPWGCRIGVHTGPLVAGVVGRNKFAYDVWGDTVNTASRMESNGVVGRVNISKATWALVHPLFECTPRGEIEAKGKGRLEMFLVERIRPEFSADALGVEPNDRFRAFIQSQG